MITIFTSPKFVKYSVNFEPQNCAVGNMFWLIILAVIILIYLFATKDHDYWAKRNVKHDPPVPLFGNHFRNQFGLKSITEIAVELYNKYPNEKIVGYYRGRTPELLIRDPELLRHILNTDFLSFYRRGASRSPEVEPLSLNLFGVEGDTWKLLRQRITPTFTNSKLKNMFPLVVKCAEKLQDVAKNISEQNEECDVRELMARFTTEFIGACGFGIEMDTLNNEQSLFRDLGRSIFTRNLYDVIKMDIYELFPEIQKYLFVGKKELQTAIYQLVSEIREKRNNKPIGRHDFIDLLLELEHKGKMIGESIEKFNKDGTPVTVEKDMDFKTMAAQVYVFLGAGFETSSSTTSYTLHELAFNPDIQTKVQEEIDEVLSRYNNKLSYEAISEMSLLAMAFKESMRIFPSLGVLNRICTRKYTIPELNITIDPGVRILIPVQAIQNDEQYFDNPKEFRLERFTPEEIQKRSKYTYLPFGEGPRACIGLRLGEMQSLAGLAALLHRFSVEPCASTLRHPKVEPTQNIVQGVRGGLPLRLVPRKP